MTESRKGPSRNGRPTKAEGPRVPYEELDRLLVFGEAVACNDGEGTTLVYPSYRELARRYGVAHSVIAEYSKRRRCLRRREVAQVRIEEKADQKLVELRATALAFSKDDELRIIDRYLAGFERALAEDRVRFDNPADFNTMVRLKEFVQGGADSRQEVHAALSLEALQSRHRKMMTTLRAGESGPDAGQEQADNLPDPATEGLLQDVSVQGAFEQPSPMVTSDEACCIEEEP